MSNLSAIGERNGPADRTVISQGNVGGISEINMDYSSMTDSFRRAFSDLPSDLGLALISEGRFNTVGCLCYLGTVASVRMPTGRTFSFLRRRPRSPSPSVARALCSAYTEST